MIDVLKRTKRANAADVFRKKPKIFFTNVLGVETLEDYQKKVIETVANNQRTAVSACHDVGKSFLMARVAMWFLNTHPNSKVITTAPTYNQVERIMWAEIRAAHSKAKFPLGGKLNTTDWTFNPEWFAIGFSTRNESVSGEGQGTQSSFQGFHASGGIMVIFDEATGIPSNTWTMAEGLLTQDNVKFVAIGNPTSKNSEFYQCFRDPAWAKVYLSCFNSPNLIANGITTKEKLISEVEKVSCMMDDEAREYLAKYKVVRPYLLTTRWVIEQTRKWGINHPLTVSKILGTFPDAGDDSLVPLSVVEEAQIRVASVSASDRKSIGVDVARFGTDASILTALHGLKSLGLKPFYKYRTTEIVGEVIQMYNEIGGADIIVVDETGVGSGVVDGLEEAKADGRISSSCEIRGVQFGGGVECNTPHDLDCLSGKHISCDKGKFFNMKSRMFGLLRDDLKNEKNGLQILKEDVYLEELPTIRIKYNSKGQLVIESKDDYKKRTGRKSPDYSDSLALANFGRYDDLKIGNFSKVYNSTQAPKPISSGIRTVKKW